MKITIDIPDTMEESLHEQFGPDVSGAVKEALAVALYRAGKLSIGRVAELLGTSINEADGLMKRWDVETPLSLEEFEHDRTALEQLLNSPNSAEGIIEPQHTIEVGNPRPLFHNFARMGDTVTVVSDTSPINYLVLIGQVEILPALFGQILVPPAVTTERQHDATPQSVREWIAGAPSWLIVRSPTQADGTARLGPGESQAIGLAFETQAALLLVDDRTAHRVAQLRGIASNRVIADALSADTGPQKQN